MLRQLVGCALVGNQPMLWAFVINVIPSTFAEQYDKLRSWQLVSVGRSDRVQIPSDHDD